MADMITPNIPLTVVAVPKLLNIILLNAPCKADLEKIYLKYYIIIPMIRVLQQF